MRRRLSLPTLAAPLLALLAIAGCGSSSHSSGTEADPASAVPAAAPLFVEAAVRPQGAVRSGALAAGQELTGQSDPYLRLLGALQTPGSATLSFKQDVAPWLGSHAGLFVTSFESAGPLVKLVEEVFAGGSASAVPFARGGVEGALVMDTTDASRARSFLAGQAKRAGAHPASYRGVSYEATSSGLAFGLVRRFAVIGSEAALRGVVDTTQGGAALSSAGGYSKLLTVAPGGALGHLYVNPSAPAAAGARGAEAQGLLALLGGRRQTNISVLAAEGSLALDIDTIGAGGGLLSAEPRAAGALGRLPGDSWLAIGIGDAGHDLAGDVAGLQTLGSLLGGEAEASSVLSLSSVVSGLTAPLKVLAGSSPAARSEFSSWMGSAGIFTAGTSLLELKGGVEIESTDAARSKAAVAKLGAALRRQGASVANTSLPGTEAAIEARLTGLPLPLDIAAGRASDGTPQFVLGLGEASVAAALAPQSTLAGAATAAAGAKALGEGATPSLLADVPTLLSLIEGLGLTETHSIAEFLPLLRATGAIAGGGHTLGGELQRYRLVVGLHSSGG